MAAHRMHLKVVLIPKRNKKDLIDVPRQVQRELDVVLVERMDEILPRALLAPQPGPPRPKPARRAPRKRAKSEAKAEVEASASSTAAPAAG